MDAPSLATVPALPSAWTRLSVVAHTCCCFAVKASGVASPTVEEVRRRLRRGGLASPSSAGASWNTGRPSGSAEAVPAALEARQGLKRRTHRFHLQLLGVADPNCGGGEDTAPGSGNHLVHRRAQREGDQQHVWRQGPEQLLRRAGGRRGCQGARARVEGRRRGEPCSVVCNCTCSHAPAPPPRTGAGYTRLLSAITRRVHSFWFFIWLCTITGRSSSRLCTRAGAGSDTQPPTAELPPRRYTHDCHTAQRRRGAPFGRRGTPRPLPLWLPSRARSCLLHTCRAPRNEGHNNQQTDRHPCFTTRAPSARRASTLVTWTRQEEKRVRANQEHSFRCGRQCRRFVSAVPGVRSVRARRNICFNAPRDSLTTRLLCC